jgi:benzodiazapine receptor
MTRDRDKAGWRVWVALGLFVGACFGAAGVGQMLSGGEPGAWYRGLRKPALTPPGWAFGPVWTALYVCMGVAAWWVWRRRGFGGARAALTAFAVQLVLNAAWTGLFFGLQRPDVAFGEIVALWVAIVVTTALFFRASAPAGWLMVPYLLWVSFASYLNFGFWRLN